MEWAREHLTDPAISIVCTLVLIVPFRRAFERWTGRVDWKVTFATIVLVMNAATMVQEAPRDEGVWVTAIVMLASAFYLVRRAALSPPATGNAPEGARAAVSSPPSASQPS